jgi:hypothetical protein
MTIPPAGYLVDNLMGVACVLAIADVGSDNTFYVFGDTFMRNFYITFDYYTNDVSFGVSSNAPSGVSIKKVISAWGIVFVTIGCLLIVVLTILLVRNRLCKRKNRLQII